MVVEVRPSEANERHGNEGPDVAHVGLPGDRRYQKDQHPEHAHDQGDGEHDGEVGNGRDHDQDPHQKHSQVEHGRSCSGLHVDADTQVLAEVLFQAAVQLHRLPGLRRNRALAGIEVHGRRDVRSPALA